MTAQAGSPASAVTSGSTAAKLEKTVRRFSPIRTRQIAQVGELPAAGGARRSGGVVPENGAGRMVQLVSFPS